MRSSCCNRSVSSCSLRSPSASTVDDVAACAPVHARLGPPRRPRSSPWRPPPARDGGSTYLARVGRSLQLPFHLLELLPCHRAPVADDGEQVEPNLLALVPGAAAGPVPRSRPARDAVSEPPRPPLRGRPPTGAWPKTSHLLMRRWISGRATSIQSWLPAVHGPATARTGPYEPHPHGRPVSCLRPSRAVATAGCCTPSATGPGARPSSS